LRRSFARNYFLEGCPIFQISSQQEKERAVLVGVVLKGMTRHEEENSLEELAFLADTAGALVVDRVLQDRHVVDPATLIGAGKVHQISRKVIELEAKVVIFDVDLSPVQMKNLEREFNRKIVDRSGLILDIFARRARTREAQIQVELAQLQYRLPRLTRQWSHLSRQEGGIGTRGPGETQLEVDRRAVRRRIGYLKEELRRIELQRGVRRKRRQDFKKVALVGYTNVGKSSLLNVLADAEVFVENRLFATLDATIRAVSLQDYRKVLLIDTVGFIRKLPPHLVASFRSTLEETVEADVLLHVVDVSHPRFEEQIGSVLEVLRELGIGEKPMITVFNKVDLLDDRRILPSLKQRFHRAVFTSAVRGMGLKPLCREISELLKEEELEGEIRIPIRETKTIAAVYEIANVIGKEYEDGKAVIRFRATQKDVSRIHKMVERIGDDENTRRG